MRKEVESSGARSWRRKARGGATERQARGSGRGALLAHGCHAPGRASPFGQSSKQVACTGVKKVGRRFGPLPGRIRHWAINEVCSPRPVLCFLFKVPGHLSFVTADN